MGSIDAGSDQPVTRIGSRIQRGVCVRAINSSCPRKEVLCYPVGNGDAGTESHLLKYGDMLIEGSGRGDLFIPQVFRISRQNGSAQFVIPKMVLDEAGQGDYRPRFKADDISCHDPQFFHIISILHNFVQQDLYTVIAVFFIVIFRIHINGSIDELESPHIIFHCICSHLSFLICSKSTIFCKKIQMAV